MTKRASMKAPAGETSEGNFTAPSVAEALGEFVTVAGGSLLGMSHGEIAGMSYCTARERCLMHRGGGNSAVPCSAGVVSYLVPCTVAGDDGTMTFPELVHEYERFLIADALKRHGGHLLEASRALGLTRTGLNNMILARHRSLSALVTDRPKGKPGHRSYRREEGTAGDDGTTSASAG